MKITGSRSYIEVELDGKTVKILGELTSTPAFYAEASSIRHWNPPYEAIKITQSEKEELIEKITREGKKIGNFPIIFE